MKFYKIIINLVLVLLLTFTFSCNDYLDLNPISEYNAGSFYATEKDFELASNGIYNVLQVLTNDLVPLTLESRSDNIQDDNINSYDHNKVHRFIDDAATPSITNIWRNYWIMIDRCNAVIHQIDNAIFQNETRRMNLKGEAYFFRGYAYFQLGFMYGGVPLIDQQLKVDEIKQTARSSQDETFNFAASDLVQAIQLLPEAWTPKELGKVTKYAAQGILARMYLFQNKYSEAKLLLQSIINSGKYQMATEYSHCFLDQYDNSQEHVFQVQYISGDLGEGNRFVRYQAGEHYRGELFPYGGVSGSLLASYDLYDTYEDGDLRRDFSIQKGYTMSSGQVDNNTLWFIKYAQGTIPPVKSDYEVNMPILRYTDVKLMYAEILNEESYDPDGESFIMLNQVRDRAGLAPLTSIDIPDQNAFRNAMLHERRVEFALEYLRWFDLLRSGNAMSEINTFLQRPEEGDGIYKMEEHRKIFAIPIGELQRNPNRDIIWQNIGY